MVGRKIPTHEIAEELKYNYTLLVNTLEGVPLNKVHPGKFTFAVRHTLQKRMGRDLSNWYVHVRLTKDTVETKLEVVGTPYTNFGVASLVFAVKFDRSPKCLKSQSRDSASHTSSGSNPLKNLVNAHADHGAVG